MILSSGEEHQLVRHSADSLKKYLEKNLICGSVKVETGGVLRFINALYDMNLTSLDDTTPVKSGRRSFATPPLFLITIDRERRPSLDAKYGRGAVNLGNEFEFYKHTVIGDHIKYDKRLSQFKKTSTSLGEAVIYTVETTFRNQKKQKVAIGRWTTMMFL